MQEKIKEFMHKLKNTAVIIPNTLIFYDIHLMKKTCFRHGILNLLPKQEEMLPLWSKLMLLGKLGLCVKFPKKSSVCLKVYARSWFNET